MINTMIPMTAQLPSGFAMPASAQTAALRGTAFGTVAGTATAAGCIAPVYVVRERNVAGDAVATPFPGTASWSPPTS